jgi:hypothetical protein
LTEIFATMTLAFPPSKLLISTICYGNRKPTQIQRSDRQCKHEGMKVNEFAAITHEVKREQVQLLKVCDTITVVCQKTYYYYYSS